MSFFVCLKQNFFHSYPISLHRKEFLLILFSAETRRMLNDLYDEIITICKIGARFYRHDPVKKAEFTYSKLLKRLRAERSSASEEKEATQK